MEPNKNQKIVLRRFVVSNGSHVANDVDVDDEGGGDRSDKSVSELQDDVSTVKSGYLQFAGKKIHRQKVFF